MEITLPVLLLPSRLHLFYQFTRPFFVRQDISWSAECPSSFIPGLLVGEFCVSFPFLGALLWLTRVAPRRVSSPENPSARRIPRLSFQRSSRRRPDLHPPPHRGRTPALSLSFALFLCLPFLSRDVSGSVPIGPACGAEGGEGSFSCPCPASGNGIPTPADSCAEANNSLTEGMTGAAHCGGRLSNPCAWHGRRGKQAASGAAPVLPRGPGGPERGAARRFIFFRGRS